MLLRNGTAAFLRNNNKYLLIKRSESKVLLPGLWSGVGGHMEPCEINDPLLTCYREIEEETGITKDKISKLELLYLIIRRSKDEISQSYIYFGETTQEEVIQTEEGTLFWVPESEWTDRQFSSTFSMMLTHYKKRKKEDRAVYVGVAEDDLGKLRIIWAKCEDFEK